MIVINMDLDPVVKCRLGIHQDQGESWNADVHAYVCLCVCKRLREVKNRAEPKNSIWLGFAMLEQENKEEARKVVPGKHQVLSESPFICKPQSAFTFICLHLTPYCTPESSWEERYYKCQVLR